MRCVGLLVNIGNPREKNGSRIDIGKSMNIFSCSIFLVLEGDFHIKRIICNTNITRGL